MGRGRRPDGQKLIEKLEASERAKTRLNWIVRSLNGECSIEQACEALGVGPSAFYKLRDRWLKESIGLLEPRPAGRPRSHDPPDEKTESLAQENERLRLELEASELSRELAETLPHVAEEPEVESKKSASEVHESNRRRKQRRKRKRRSR